MILTTRYTRSDTAYSAYSLRSNPQAVALPKNRRRQEDHHMLISPTARHGNVTYRIQ